MSNRKIILTLAIVFTIGFIASCDNGDDNKPVVCTCPEGTTHEPNQKCCEGTDCNCQIAEPKEREFSITFNFEYDDSGEQLRNANIKDERTKCGSADLENVKVDNKSIITIIEEAVMGAFNNVATSGPQRNRFRNVFGVEGGVTIYVDNPETSYKMRAPDKKTIYIHIDYLKSTPADIQQKVFDMVTAMNDGGENLPYEAK
jgi:hypothetical protein